VPDQKRLLVVMAHPDDESFGIGPLIAKYVGDGVEVSLICTTNGDIGTVDEKYMQGYRTIAEMRLAELDCAAKVLGFKEVILFGYRDSGMMGNADNQHADCLWHADLAAVTNRVAEVMQRIKPQVVLTFDPYGGYGHPDHIKTHKATVAAFQLLQGTVDAPQKLYYNSIPRFLVRLGLFMIKLMGRNPRKQGRNNDIDYQAVYDNLQPIHTKVDVRGYIDKGLDAAVCHASQGGEGQGRPLVRFLVRLLVWDMSLTRAYPQPADKTPIERDVFAGVTL
jgi:LmbE family N-acetylglucosaminyl deacetylase